MSTSVPLAHDQHVSARLLPRGVVLPALHGAGSQHPSIAGPRFLRGGRQRHVKFVITSASVKLILAGVGRSAGATRPPRSPRRAPRGRWGAPSTRRAPVLQLRGRCRAAQSRILQNRGERFEDTQREPSRRLVPPHKGADWGVGFMGKYPTSTRSATRPPISGSRIGCRVLGFLYFFKKRKDSFLFLKPYKNPRTRHQNRRPDMGGIVADRVLAGYSPKYPASTRQKLFFHAFFYVFADEAGLCCKFIGPAPQRGRATKRGLAMRATQRRARRRWGGAADQAQAALAVGGLANAGRRQSVSRPPGAREPAMRCPAKRRQVE